MRNQLLHRFVLLLLGGVTLIGGATGTAKSFVVTVSNVGNQQAVISKNTNIIHVPGDYPTIAEALAAAQAGDTVQVAPGTYVEGQLDVPVGVALVGSGYQQTSIDGNGTNVVVYAGADSTVRGFTIRGAGTDYFHAGIWVGFGAATITDNRITDNTAGVLAWCFEPETCNIHVTLERNIIDANRSNGVNSNEYPVFTLRNNTIVRNGEAGVVLNHVASTAENNLIAHNTGDGLLNRANATVRYNNVWGNQQNYAGGEVGTGGISADPLFRDLENGDYRLHAGSPVIGAGTPAGTDMGALPFLPVGQPPLEVEVSQVTTGAWQISWSGGTDSSYFVYYGPCSRQQTTIIPVSNVNTYEVTGITADDIGYVAVSTYDISLQESNVQLANGVQDPCPATPQLPSLAIPNDLTAQVNATVTVPVAFQSGGADVAYLIFLLDYDETCLYFDPADSNADNVPDSVSFFLPENFDVDVYLGAVETEGAVGIVIFDSQSPYTQLPDLNPLVAIEFSVICNPSSSSQIAPIRFSNDPSPAFGSSNGGSVSGTAIDGAVTILGTALPVTLPTDATGAPNSQVTIPVTLPDPVDGRNIIAYGFQINFDPTVLSIVGANTTGTLSGGWGVTANTGTPGEVQIAAFNTTPLSGSGPLLNLVFDVVGAANDTTALTWANFLFNEGEPAAQTTDGFFTALSWVLGGQVYYQDRTDRAMSDVTLDLTGASTAQTTTDAEEYSFTIEASGAHTITPAYAGPVNGITAFDAAYIAQCVAGLRNSTDCPLLAADTSGNSSLSAFDAALIAQYAAGLAGPTSRVGTWVFDPASRSYATIESDLLAEDFGAYLVGEVTGNWSAPAVAAAQQASGAAPLAAVAHDNEVTLQLSQPHAELLAFQATIRYDGSAGRFVAAQPTQVLGVGWELVAHAVAPGVIVVVGYGTTPADGAGELVSLQFQATAEGGQLAPTITQAQLNEERLWVGQVVPAHQQFLPLIVN